MLALWLLIGCLKDRCSGDCPCVCATDDDDDGYQSDDCGGDCDDEDPSVHPGAAETPGDSIDSNCDGKDDS